MRIHVVSAEFLNGSQWRAVKAFTNEEEADDYAYELYNKGWCRLGSCDELILDTRVDEVFLKGENYDTL